MADPIGNRDDDLVAGTAERGDRGGAGEFAEEAKALGCRLYVTGEASWGDVIAADTFAAGEKVDVTGLTKGHGYTGAVKRWNQHTLCSTHGVGPIHREVGSMGPNSTPSRVYKNKHMAGQYGNEQVTILNLKVVKIDAERNLIAVKGAVPGAKDGIVFIRDSIKA